IMALVHHPALPALLEERPDLIVVLVREGKIRAPELGRAQLTHELFGGGRDHPLRPCTLRRRAGSARIASASRRSRAGSSQSIHIPSRIDCSVICAAYVSTRSLQRFTNGPMPNVSMSRLLRKPRSRSTFTSTHSP